MKKKVILFIMFVCSSAMGFSQLQIDGQIRTRYEYRDGYKTLPTESTYPNLLIGQRTRITFHYNLDKIDMKMSLQDARVWGESKFRTDNNVLDIFEAWAKYNFNEKFAMKLGRQVLKYDDQRLFCTADWRDFAQTMDVALFQFNGKEMSLRLDAGFGVNNNSSAEMNPWLEDYELRSSANKNLAYVWINKSFAENKFNVSLMNVMDGHQKADVLNADSTISTFPDEIKYRFTTGSYVKYKVNNLTLEGAFYYQTGKNSSNQEISAHFYSIKSNYNLNNVFSLFAGYDHYSGTDYTDTENKEINTFSNLFGPGHKFLGYMDYFGKPDKHGSGINDAFIGSQVKILKKNKLHLTYHYFNLDKGALKSGDVVDKSLGSEIDLVLSRQLSDNVAIKLGYSFMFATETMEKLKGIEAGKSEFPHFGYVIIKFTPTIFKQKS